MRIPAPDALAGAGHQRDAAVETKAIENRLGIQDGVTHGRSFPRGPATVRSPARHRAFDSKPLDQERARWQAPGPWPDRVWPTPRIRGPDPLGHRPSCRAFRAAEGYNGSSSPTTKAFGRRAHGTDPNREATG